MIPSGLWKLLHLFFAFSFVGSLIVAEWNGRMARATQNWEHRALLYQIIHLSSRVAGLGALIMVGIFGNVTLVALGYSMASESWPRVVNGIWLLAVLVMALVNVPYSRRLAAISRVAAGGGTAEGYESALARWRFANVVQSVLYLVLLTIMVFRWRS
jgi:hypothetical protein